MIHDEQLQNWFTHHPPTDQRTIESYELIRAAGLAFATVIRDLTPPSKDQTEAIRLARNAVFFANASIACGGA